MGQFQKCLCVHDVVRIRMLILTDLKRNITANLQVFKILICKYQLTFILNNKTMLYVTRNYFKFDEWCIVQSKRVSDLHDLISVIILLFYLNSVNFPQLLGKLYFIGFKLNLFSVYTHLKLFLVYLCICKNNLK